MTGLEGLRVLLVHTRYRQPGGEDAVVEAEATLLRGAGADVHTLIDTNARLADRGRLSLAATAVWSPAATRWLRDRIREVRPDVVHVHNTFFALSPAILHAAHASGVPVVQTLHNYRLLCPAANLFRDGRPCEACVGRRFAWPGVARGCYRGSRAATGVAAATTAVHHLLGTWSRRVDVYIALTEFARAKAVVAGLPRDRIVVKPNFLAADPGVGEHRGGFALFVGRLSPEKGVDTLVRAWRCGGITVPLRVVGAGPLDALRSAAPATVSWVGWRDRSEVLELMRDAAFLVLPSNCYEGFPLTLVEAFATGLPVFASRHGAMAEILEDGRTGRLFEPGSADALARAVRHALAHPAALARMGRHGRAVFEAQYTAERQRERIAAIYARARGESAGDDGAAARRSPGDDGRAPGGSSGDDGVSSVVSSADDARKAA